MGPQMITAVKKRGNDIEKEDLGGGEEGALSPNSHVVRMAVKGAFQISSRRPRPR